MTINTNTRSLKYLPTPRNFNTPPVSNINRQAVSLIGTGVAGIPFVPQFFNQYNGTSLANALNAAVINLGDFTFNQRQLQGEILPYLTNYAILQSGGQVNYTRICGINLPDFPQLTPGFTLNNQYSLYLMTLSMEIPTSVNNYYNFENNNSSQKYYQAIILAKNSQISIFKRANNNFNILVTPVEGTELHANMIHGNPDINSKSLQDKLFTFQNDDKPLMATKFNFNINDDRFFWKNSLNTDLKRIDTFGYAILNYADIFNKINFESLNANNNKIFIQLTQLSNANLKNFAEPCRYATTPWFVSQGFYTSSQNKDRVSVGLHLKDRVLKLFKIHAISPGSFPNNLIIRIIPASLSDNQQYAKFHLHLVDRTSNDIFYEFNYLNLNPDSEDFIGRVIGTQKKYFDITSKNIVVEGDYPNQNPWIRVELSDAVNHKNIPIDTIPAGFLGKNRFKSDLGNQNYHVLNDHYTVSPHFEKLEHKFNSFDLAKSHAWGVNLKNVQIKKNILLNRFIVKINKDVSESKKTKNSDDFSMLEYSIPSKLILNRNNDQTHYLNQNFYEINMDEYEDMFHLEKILLLNEYIPDTDNYRQAWEYAKYIQSGANVNNLKTVANNWTHFFNNNINYENVMYYFTVNRHAITSDDINLDTIEEADAYDDKVNVLAFQVDLAGGWDGLNLLDNDEYVINDKGLEKSQYLRELYKLALDINIENVNGQNEIIYLPEIYNAQIVNYISDLVYDKNHLLILDQPLYDINNQIIYTRDFLKLDGGKNNIEYGFSHQKYQLISNDEIDALNFSLDQTIANWSQGFKQQSNIISFGNYMSFKLLSGPDKPFNALGVDQTLVLPAGFIAVNSLITFDVNDRKMNPIYNININSFGDINVESTMCKAFDQGHPNFDQNLRKIRDLNLNILQAEIIAGANQYRFYSDKTQLFDSYNNSILSKLNVRNTLNDIKKKIELVSYPQLFRNILSKKEIVDRVNTAYSLLLASYVARRLINNFKVTLDINTTSDEDILNGIVRGSIYLQFLNQEIVQIPV